MSKIPIGHVAKICDDTGHYRYFLTDGAIRAYIRRHKDKFNGGDVGWTTVPLFEELRKMADDLASAWKVNDQLNCCLDHIVHTIRDLRK